MIYLIEGAGFSSTGGFERELKVGYTSEGKERFEAYQIHNPTRKILYMIPGWSMKLEQSLHKFFSHLPHVGDCKEWYLYSDTIIKFFEDNKDKSEAEVKEYVDTILKGRSYGYDLIGDDLVFLNGFFIGCKNVQDRIKFVFEYPKEISPGDLEQTGEIMYYHTKLTTTRAKELSYNREAIRKECLMLDNNVSEVLSDSIEVGEIYSKKKLEKIIRKLENQVLHLPEFTIEDFSMYYALEEIKINGGDYYVIQEEVFKTNLSRIR